jgi:hypothetical protein
MRKLKDYYLTRWKSFTKKQSKLEFYLALNREYTVAVSIALLLRKAAEGRPGSQEKTLPTK